MGFPREKGGTMSLSASKQSAIGSAATVNRRLNNRGNGANNRYPNLYNDRDEGRGSFEGSVLQRTMAAPYLPFNVPCDDISGPILMAYALGSDTMTTPSGATNARQHAISGSTLYTELPFATVQYNRIDLSTTSILKNTGYLGCALKSLTLAGAVNQPEVRASGVWVGSGGTQAAVTLSGMAAPAVGAFLSVNSFARIGTGMAGSWSPVLPASIAPTGAELAGSVDWSSYLIGWQFNIENKFAEDIGHTGSLGYTANCLPLVDRVMKLTLTLRWDDSIASLNNFNDPSSMVNSDGAGTLYPSLALYNWSTLTLDSSGSIYTMSQTHIFPRLGLMGEPELTTHDGIQAWRVTYEVQKDATNNPYYGYWWNKDNQAYAG